jgi:hypothetical protein
MIYYMLPWVFEQSAMGVSMPWYYCITKTPRNLICKDLSICACVSRQMIWHLHQSWLGSVACLSDLR